MVDKTPVEIIAGDANDESVVHASDADVSDFSRSHKERDISRLQSAMLAYDDTKTYNLGDIVREVGFNWINIVPITIPEAFDTDNWAFIDNGLGVVFIAYNTDTAVNNEFFVISGGDSTGDPDEDDAQAPVAGAFSLVFFTIQIQTNTRDNDTEWAFRKNGADSISVITIPSAATGVFQDVSSTESMVLGDLICYQYRELVTTTGALTIFGSSCATRRTET